MEGIRVLWIHCKPFPREMRESPELHAFQEECLQNRFFGIGWKEPGDRFFKEHEGEEYCQVLAEECKNRITREDGRQGFSTALNKIGLLDAGDVVVTRLNDVYYAGVMTCKPHIFPHPLLSWGSRVNDWVRLGTSAELPHHVRGKLSGRFISNTTAFIKGLAEFTIYSLVGVKIDNKPVIHSSNFWLALGDEDLEDLVAYYMSKHHPDYVFLPSSCKKNTPGVEYVFYNPISGRQIACQTKVDCSIDSAEYLNNYIYRNYEVLYLFSGKDCMKYDGINSMNIRFIDRKELFSTLLSNVRFTGIIEQYFDIDKSL